MSRASATFLACVLLVFMAGCGGGGDEAGSDESTQPAVVGDPVAGKAVFEQQGCGNCHTFAAAGSRRNQGPNLNEVGRRYDAAFIRESIVNPEAYIEKGSGGSIGGAKGYRNIMPPFGPTAETDQNRITEQQIADLVSFLTQ